MEQKRLMNELMQGKELAKQLTNHFQSCSSSETRLFLIEKILSSYEKSLSMLKLGASDDDINRHFHSSNSPGSDGSLPEGKNSRRQTKKRKTLPKWTERVKVCPGTEGPLNDGHSWRKYGQKDILGAKFPRCYYRCTHRHGRGCWATKQIQRSDQDQTIFEITYNGRHTCTQVSQSVTQVSQSVTQVPETPKKPDGKFFDFGGDFEVKIEGSEIREDEIFPSICSSNGSAIEEENILTDLLIENDFPLCPSPPPPSESYYFPASQMSSFRPPPYNVHTTESDLADIISAPLSVSSSPFDDFDFDFDLNFHLEDLNSFDSTSILF